MLSNPGRIPTEPGRVPLCIDAKVMAQARVSGIGHTLRGLVRALEDDAEVQVRYGIRLLTPWDGVERVRKLARSETQVVRMPMPIRGWDRWSSLRVLPPLDMLVGSGVFVFPHFGNWPLRSSSSITFIHDLAFLRHPETVGGNLRLLLRNSGRWIARTDVVATASEFTRGEVMRYLGLPPERTAVVPWGVDTDIFRASSDAEISSLHRRYGLPERYILYLGNIEPRKNLVRLLRAYRSLPQRLRAEHALVLAGGHGWNDREIAAEVEAAVRARERVVQPNDYVTDTDLPALISGASLLAQPSLYEGFGVAPLQAMACGVPVVVAANSAQPEVAGDAAEYVDAMSVEHIAAALERVLTDSALRDRMVTTGHTRAGALTWRRSGRAMLEALQRLDVTPSL